MPRIEKIAVTFVGFVKIYGTLKAIKNDEKLNQVVVEGETSPATLIYKEYSNGTLEYAGYVDYLLKEDYIAGLKIHHMGGGLHYTKEKLLESWLKPGGEILLHERQVYNEENAGHWYFCPNKG